MSLTNEAKIISLLQQANSTLVEILKLLRFLAGEKLKEAKLHRDSPENAQDDK